MRSSLISRMERRTVRVFVDEDGALDARLLDGERADDAPAGCVVEDALDEAGSVGALVADPRQIVGQYIARVGTIESIRVVAESVADEERTDAVLERQS